MKVVNIFTNIIIIIVVVDVVAMCSSVPSSVVGINNNNNNDDDINNNNNNDDDINNNNNNDDSVIILSNIIIASVSNSTASTTRANGSNTHTINTSSDNKNNNNNNNNNNKAIKNNTPEPEKTIEQQSFSTRNCSKFNENPLGSHNNNNNNDCENNAIRKISNDGSISAGTPRRLWHPDDRYFRKIGESEIKRSGISLPPAVPTGVLSVRSAGTPKPSRDRQPPVRHRAKRFIIFDGSGVVKLVMGTSFPIKLADPQRSVSISYNLQSQYTPPPVPLYWWSFFNTTAFAARHQRDAPPHHDASRMFAYAIIEQFLESQGIPGGVCLLKAICLVAQQPIHGASVFHAILNTIFTPSAANIDERYLDAQAAGRYGADCAQTFDKCPHHVNAFKGASFRI